MNLLFGDVTLRELAAERAHRFAYHLHFKGTHEEVWWMDETGDLGLALVLPAGERWERLETDGSDGEQYLIVRGPKGFRILTPDWLSPRLLKSGPLHS